MNPMENGEPIKFSTEREKSENEVLLAEIMPIFSELEYEYHFGGDEDPEGEPVPGAPDFEGAKEKLTEALDGAPEDLKERTMQALEALSQKCSAAKEGEWFDFTAAVKEVEGIYLNDLGTQEQIAAKEELLKDQQERLVAALDAFVEGHIVNAPAGSAERRTWGNALKDYQGGNPEALIAQLEEAAKQTGDQQTKEWLRFLRFNKKEKDAASGETVVYPPTGSFS